jgi:hypothetical protein
MKILKIRQKILFAFFFIPKVLELDVIREIYRLPTAHALSPTKRAHLAAFFHAANSARSVQPLEDAATAAEGGKIPLVAQSLHERTLRFVYRDLAQILGGAARLQIVYPLPHSTAKCLVFKLDADGRPVVVNDKDEDIFAALAHRDEAAAGWRLVMVAKRAEVAKGDGRLLGSLKAQLDQLRALGYRRPVVIAGPRYFAALKQKKNLSFLRKEINLRKLSFCFCRRVHFF